MAMVVLSVSDFSQQVRSSDEELPQAGRVGGGPYSFTVGRPWESTPPEILDLSSFAKFASSHERSS